MKLTKNKWTRVGFSIKTGVVNALNSVPRNVVPNKSKFVESLIVKWLTKNNFIQSGSL